MEYAKSKSFEDRPTLAVVNRKVSPPSFKVSDSGSVVTIATSDVELTYDSSKGAFSSESLQVSSLSQDSAFKKWDPSMNSANDAQNLRGTYRTLDGTKNVSLDCNNNGKMGDHCAFGLISRSGFAILNDTLSPVLDDDDWWADSNGKPLTNLDDEDLYIFAHGHAYKDALKDYVSIGGSIPLIPRSNFGVWYVVFDLENHSSTRIFCVRECQSRYSVERSRNHSPPLNYLNYISTEL